MINIKTNIYIILLSFSAFLFCGYAQSNRSTLNDGVDKYEEKKYSDAEIDFRKVVENTPKNFEANFNLGTSYYKQEKYDDAIKSFQSAFENAKDDENRGKVYHNIGNALLKSNKIEQSVEAYKNALKFNPNDQETKYNLSYALEMLKNKDKDKNKQDKNDKDKKDQDKKDQQQQNQDQKNNDKDKQDQKQNPQPKDQESKQDNTKQPKEQKISKDEAKRILDALKDNEKDLQKLLRKKTGKVKKTEKDW